MRERGKSHEKFISNQEGVPHHLLRDVGHNLEHHSSGMILRGDLVVFEGNQTDVFIGVQTGVHTTNRRFDKKQHLRICNRARIAQVLVSSNFYR